MSIFANVYEHSSMKHKMEAICTLGAIFWTGSSLEEDYHMFKDGLLHTYHRFLDGMEDFDIYYITVGYYGNEDSFDIGVDKEGNMYKRTYLGNTPTIEKCNWEQLSNTYYKTC